MARSKYGNRRTTIDGITFDSAKEALRWQELRLLEAAGEIRNLARQARYRLEVNGAKVCDYVADFTYDEGDTFVVEDVKGRRTPVYSLKKKLMKAIHGIEIRET